ncbi:FkbM family methyltransferase [Granulicella aggregans]|uniref:FkbM family methyltransferase n=1 Tax=Granulicella aggregans TaxID=474949 RepID=A0A7W7ZA45_9BACT|nr:FkbM family methyltransferase [Granulicella aggregans]MBB5056136.1 FkbM family methyltransferase [Granulicella aggregans]
MKRRLPTLHGFLKQSLRQSQLPVPKMLFGRPVWTHPRLLNIRLNEPHVMRWISERLHPGDVFFDVGAHQGWMSMVAARRVGVRGRVAAFEPSPALLESLSFHKRLNRLSQLDIVSKAVSNRDELTPFHLVGDGNSFMNSLAGTEITNISPENLSVIEIEAITLDTYSRQSGLVPHLIKIDTEGSEMWVCEGARHLLAQHHPALIIATHPPWLPKGQTVEALFDLLNDHGYRIVDSVISRYKQDDFGDYLCIAD